MIKQREVASKLKECKETMYAFSTPGQKALVELIYALAEAYVNQTDALLTECVVEEDEFISAIEFVKMHKDSISADYLSIVCRTMPETREFAELRKKTWYVKTDKMREYLANQNTFPLVAKRFKDYIRNSKNK